MASIRLTFDGHVQRKTARTFCTACGKKLSRVVSRHYYDNGFHKVSETRTQNWAEIDAEIAKLVKDGCVCKECEDAANGLPVLKKRNADEYEVFSRAKKPERLGLVRRVRFGGWVKWQIVKPKVCLPHCRSLEDAQYKIAKIPR